MAHIPKYLNGITIGPVICAWPHLFQPRDFKNNQQYRYDCSFILSAEMMNKIYPQIYQLAQQAFQNNEFQNQNFNWPMSPSENKQKVADFFPGHYVISAKAFPESPPSVYIHGPNGLIDMPEDLRSKWVYDGAECWAALDFASFHTGSNIGIRCQMNSVFFTGRGNLVAIGNRPDGRKLFEEAGALANSEVYQGPGAGAGGFPGGHPGMGQQQPGMGQQQPGMGQQASQQDQPGMQMNAPFPEDQT